jgi:Holliday junction resolvase
MVSNKSAGTAFEKEFAQMLAANGFWVHRLQDNKNGQPADIIAAINESAFLIDCKDCQGDTFQFSRIEPNQRSAMDLWYDCGNGSGLFAVRFPTGNVYMVPYLFIKAAEEVGIKSYDEPFLFSVWADFNRWARIVTRIEDGEYERCDWQ